MFEFYQFPGQQIVQRFVLYEHLGEVLPQSYRLQVSQRLQEIRPQQPRAPVGQTGEVLYKGVGAGLGLRVDEDLQIGNSLRMDNQDFLKEVPLDVESTVSKSKLKAAFEETNQSIERSKR